MDPAYAASLFQNQLRVKEDEKTLVIPVLNSALSPVSSRGGAEEEALAKSASTSIFSNKSKSENLQELDDNGIHLQLVGLYLPQ